MTKGLLNGVYNKMLELKKMMKEEEAKKEENNNK